MDDLTAMRGFVGGLAGHLTEVAAHLAIAGASTGVDREHAISAARAFIKSISASLAYIESRLPQAPSAHSTEGEG